MKRTETFGDNPFKIDLFNKSEIRVLALLKHQSGKRSHGTFYVTRCSRGVTKQEIAIEIKKEINQSGVIDKVTHVIVKLLMQRYNEQELFQSLNGIISEMGNAILDRNNLIAQLNRANLPKADVALRCYLKSNIIVRLSHGAYRFNRATLEQVRDFINRIRNDRDKKVFVENPAEYIIKHFGELSTNDIKTLCQVYNISITFK